MRSNKCIMISKPLTKRGALMTGDASIKLRSLIYNLTILKGRCPLSVNQLMLYLRYTDTSYKVLTFNSTDFLFLNTLLHTTDLMIHDFELHEIFYSPKNVHLKALL